MLFLARTHERLGRVHMWSTYADELPHFCRFHSGNVVGSYRYTNLDYCSVDITKLRADQVTMVVFIVTLRKIYVILGVMTPMFMQIQWTPWTDLADRLGYQESLAASWTRQLFCHEYEFVFYLGERVMRQYSPKLPLRIP